MSDFLNNNDLTSRLGSIRRDGEERDAKRRAEQAGLAYADVRKIPVSIDALKLVTQEEAKKGKLAVVEMKNKKLAIVLADPDNEVTKAVLSGLEHDGYISKVYISSETGVSEAHAFYKFVAKETKDITGEVSLSEESRPQSFKQLKEQLEEYDFSEMSTSHLFQMVVGGALTSNASDIHLEAKELGMLFRLRIDGILHDVATIPLRNYRGLLNRIKLLSGLKLNVRSEAQDGRFSIDLGNGNDAEVRVSMIPSEAGEIVVMRVLDPDALAVNIADLGMRPDAEAIALKELTRPNGLILNTGPTGSGKTTTLYSFLRHITNPEKKVITIEDPIEYKIEGIDQTQVDAEGGYTFSSGLRSVLRQDPDVLLIGEIRDGETADIALQAALTGHLVFSTLHTNSSFGAIPRLVDLEVRPAAIAPAVNLIIAQRLVRILCACKQEQPFTEEQKKAFSTLLEELPEQVDKTPYLEMFEKGVAYMPGSCDLCGGFGYKGRIGIFEFLRMTPEIQELINKDTSELTLKKMAVSQGMVTMQQDGLLKALLGTTTIDEVVSITGPLE